MRSPGPVSWPDRPLSDGRRGTARHSIRANITLANGGQRGRKRIAVSIYTRTGDDGSTGLLGPGRVSKADIRVEAYGCVDETNAAVGTARALGLDADCDALAARLQDELFLLGSALADRSPDGKFLRVIGPAHIQRLETEIDRLEAGLEPLAHFILPGGTPGAAQLHLARTVCRRAERAAVELSQRPDEHLPAAIIVYLNRLSDLLFVMARAANHRAGVPDVIWKGVAHGE